MDITPHSVFSPGLVIFITHLITSYLTVDVAQQWASSVPIPTHPRRQPITTTLALDQIPSIEGSSCYKGGFGRHWKLIYIFPGTDPGPNWIQGRMVRWEREPECVWNMFTRFNSGSVNLRVVHEQNAFMWLISMRRRRRAKVAKSIGVTGLLLLLLFFLVLSNSLVVIIITSSNKKRGKGGRFLSQLMMSFWLPPFTQWGWFLPCTKHGLKCELRRRFHPIPVPK